jgi:hypothetical protein
MKLAARLSLLCVLAACGGDDAASEPDAGRGDASAHPNDHEDAGEEDAGVAPAPPPPVCSVDNFCWELPKPQGQTLRAIWNTAANDAWVVGDRGIVLRYDGASFRAEHVDTHQDLLAVHGSGPRDVWAVGRGGAVLHYDGEQWSKTDVTSLIDASGGASTGVLYGVFAAAPDAVWAVGHNGVSALIIFYDGEKWISQPLAMATPQALRAVWGFSREQLWAVGDAGVIRSFDGAQWNVDKTPTGAALNAIHGLVAHDVWAVGASGAAVRWNGTAWSNANAGLAGALSSVRVDIAAPPPVMDAGMPMPAPMPMPTLDAGPMDPKGPWSVWAFGEKGHAYRYNGTVWAQLASGTELPLYAAARLREGTLIAVGEHGQVSRFERDARQSLSSGSRRNHLGMWGDGKTLWVVGDEIARRDATGWTTVTSPSERALYGVWGDANGLWAVGTAGSILRYERGSFTAREVAVAADVWLHAVWGTSSSMWIVGDAGLTLVAAAGSFIKVATPVRSNLLDVWGIADDAFWAVGDGGTVLRWDGMAWLRVPTGPMGGVVQNLRAVWGSGRDDVWVVGTEGTILHWDGSRFSSMPRGTAYSLNDVWGRSRDEIYAVGSGGTALRYDGSQWSELQTGTSSSLQSVFGDGQGRVFAAGLDGVVLALAL